jgi:hypothetical protein
LAALGAPAATPAPGSINAKLLSRAPQVKPRRKAKPGEEEPKGRDAKAATGEEATDFVKEAVAALDKKMSALASQSKKKAPTWQPVVLSLDNASVHNAVWRDPQFEKSPSTKIPPYSGDMHNVIEGSHAIVCTAFQKFVNSHVPKPGDPDLLSVYTTELERLFYSMLTPEWAMKAVKRLYAVTLPAIIQADGDYPPKAFR